MIQTKPLTEQCPHCGATVEHLAYHSRYALKGGQMAIVIRCKQNKGAFCDRYGTAALPALNILMSVSLRWAT
jgi:hypothetical protein